MKPQQSMRNYLAECMLHAEVLNDGLVDAKAWMPLLPEMPIEKQM